MQIPPQNELYYGIGEKSECIMFSALFSVFNLVMVKQRLLCLIYITLPIHFIESLQFVFKLTSDMMHQVTVVGDFFSIFRLRFSFN